MISKSVTLHGVYSPALVHPPVTTGRPTQARRPVGLLGKRYISGFDQQKLAQALDELGHARFHARLVHPVAVGDRLEDEHVGQ